MDDVANIVTRRAVESDVDEAATVLASAFAHSPWIRWTVDPDRRAERVTALQQLALSRIGLPYGSVWISVVGGAVGCVASWHDSAVEIPSAVTSEVEALLADLEGSRHDVAMAAERQAAATRPSERHLFLGVVGTAPALQRTGLARRTLAPLIAGSRELAVPVYLETSNRRNLAFYGSMGFDLVTHQLIDGGGPDVWGMRFDPHATR